MNFWSKMWLGMLALMIGATAFGQVLGDVTITEVMFRTAGDPDVEWVELHNTTASSIDLSNWALMDGEGTMTVPAGTSISAGGYMVFSVFNIADTIFVGEVTCTQTGSFTLANGGDQIALYTAATGGILIDGSASLGYPTIGAIDGTTIEKCDPNALWSASPSAWHLSTNVYSTTLIYRYCTPGAPNSPCADTTPPSILSLTVVSSTQLDILFSEAVNQTIAETVTNYSVDLTVGNPLTATRDGGNTSLVHLTFNVMSPNSYTLTVVTVQDLNGNSASNLTRGFAISSIEPDAVVITEIMYDDAVDGIDIEWVEIYNTTASAIDISGWALSDDPLYPATTEGVWEVPAATSLAAGQYLVLSGIELPEITGEVICTAALAWAGLGNSGDNLTLHTAVTGEALIHGSFSVNYPDLCGQNLGYSLEKCLASVGQPWSAADWYESDTQFATTGRYRNCTPGSAPHACVPDVTGPVLDSVTFYSANQCQAYFNEALNATSANTTANYSLDNGFGAPSIAAIQGDNRTVRLTFASSFLPNTYTLTVNNVTDIAGNPVAANSQGSFVVTPPPAGIIFTEVMPNPNLAGNLDTLGEWFEIYNGDISTFDLQGWEISDNNGSHTIVGSHLLAPGDYFVFCSNGDSLVNGGVPEDYDYPAGSGVEGGLTLNNTGETLSLLNASDVLVASVNYTGYPWLAGASAQLSNVLLDPANPANWCAAQVIWSGATLGDHGTPGAANICSAPQVPDTVTICQIRQQDACGVSLWKDSLVVTYGVVTLSDSCRRNMFVESNGCAVLVFGTAARTRWTTPDRLPLPGDSVCISGSLLNYNGLTEFNSTALYPAEVTLITTGNPVPSAVGVPASAVSQLAAACSPEQYESRHIEVQNVSFDTTGGVDTFLAATNFYLKNGSDSVTFRIDLCDTLVGKPIPVGLLNVTGILSQFDAASCYCESYQLVTGALAPFETAACLDPANLTVLRLGGSSIIELRWLPGVGQPCACYNVWYAASAEAVFPAEYTLLTATPITATTYQDALGADAKRFYVVEAVACP